MLNLKQFFLVISCFALSSVWGMEDVPQSTGQLPSPEEQKFIKHIVQWTSKPVTYKSGDDVTTIPGFKKFLAFRLVLQEELSTQNAELIKKITGFVRSYAEAKCLVKNFNKSAWSISWNLNGDYAISAENGDSIYLWDLKNKKDPRLDKTIAVPFCGCVSRSPNSNYVLCGTENELVILLNLRNGKAEFLKVHRNVVSSVCWSPDGNYGLSGSWDFTIKLWDLRDKENPKLVITLDAGRNGGVPSVSFSPDGNYALSGHLYSKIFLWDLRDKEKPNPNPVASLSVPTRGAYSVSWSPDGNYALSGADKAILLWDLRDKEKPEADPVIILKGHTKGGVESVSWSSDGNYALSCAGDETIKLWDLRNKKNPKTDPVATLAGQGQFVNSVSWSPKENYALSGSKFANVCEHGTKLWDLGKLVALAELPEEIMKWKDNYGDYNGVLKYLLLKSIFEQQENSKHPQYKTPFRISYKKVKEIFDAFPKILKDAFIAQNYVVLG